MFNSLIFTPVVVISSYSILHSVVGFHAKDALHNLKRLNDAQQHLHRVDPLGSFERYNKQMEIYMQRQEYQDKFKRFGIMGPTLCRLSLCPLRYDSNVVVAEYLENEIKRINEEK